jgi:hypothetical protein
VRSAATAGVMDCERRLLRALHADWRMRDVMVVDWTTASRPAQKVM